jgi:hypothetical protein
MARAFGGSHGKPRSHDRLAKAGDVEVPLLRHWQRNHCDP